MKNCDEILTEFGVDFLENEKIPSPLEEHFKNCPYCIRELEKQKDISKIFKENTFEGEIPKFDLPPVLRKKERFSFLILSLFFFSFFLFFHSIINVEFLKPYYLIFSNFNLIPAFKHTKASIFIIVLILFITISIIYQLKKFLKKI